MSPSATIIDTKDLRKIFTVFFRNWYIIVICLLLAATVSYIYTTKQAIVYAASTQILLQNDQTYNYQEGLYAGLGMYGSDYQGYEKMSNEQRVIQSSDLISKTIEKQKWYVDYYIVGKVQTKPVYQGMPFHVDAIIYSNDYFESPFVFRIKDLSSYEIIYLKGDKKVTETYSFGETVIKKEFYLLISSNPGLNASTLEDLKKITYQFIVRDQGGLVQKYKSALSVTTLEWTAIMEVKIEDESPERAKSFLDTLAQVYIDNSLKNQISVNNNTLNFINKQMNEVVTILDSIEDNLENYKEQKSILNLTKEEETYYSNLVQQETNKRQLEMKIKNIDFLKDYIKNNSNKDLLPPAMYIDEGDKYLQTTMQELYSSQVRINNALFSTTEQSMGIKEVEYKVELLRNDIMKYLVNSDKAIRTKISTVDAEILFYESMLKGIPRNQRELLNINRKLQVNEKMYVYLLEKRAETIIARAGIISETSVIESAHSIGIVKPDKQKILSSFLSMGLLISLVIVFLRTVLFNKIESIDELKTHTTLPILGEVLYSKTGKGSYIAVEADPKAPITESFRTIRTNLEYMAPGTKSKVVLITSSNPGEGKTFCSINIASILAKAGKKVLILEMDLHKPKVQIGLNLTSETGVSTILIGKSSPAETILKTQIENMDVILSGPTPPNASELILSKHMEDILDYGRNNYDYVIIDTPPVGLISDAVVLMKKTDVNLFVVNTKQARRESVENAHGIVNTNKVENFGFILNWVKRKKSKYYYNRYTYGYGYGYGYGSKNNQSY